MAKKKKSTKQILSAFKLLIAAEDAKHAADPAARDKDPALKASWEADQERRRAAFHRWFHVRGGECVVCGETPHSPPIDTEDWVYIRAAAEAAGMTPGHFMLRAARTAAEQLLNEGCYLLLGTHDHLISQNP